MNKRILRWALALFSLTALLAVEWAAANGMNLGQEAALPLQTQAAADRPAPAASPTLAEIRLPTSMAAAPLPQATTENRPTQTAVALPAERWKEWPEIPRVSENARQLHLQGVARGANPRAFSFIGDCQSLPEVFLGVYERDPAAAAGLPQELKETLKWFAGSLDRYSPTVKDGTTAGAVLWYEWNDNKEKLCQYGETPLDCELRVHNPSIVVIHLGTHWEARNLRYLDLIISRIIEHGALPVLATKADNREQDERMNHDMAAVALQYDLPLWNFWASVQDLPNHGLDPKSDNVLLSEAGLARHRLSALKALDAIRRAVSE